MTRHLFSPVFDSEAESFNEAQAARRHRIIEEATALAVSGYEHVQIRTVAVSAGISATTVYQYFPSKDHLLLTCFYQWLCDFETTHHYESVVESDHHTGLLTLSETITGELCASPRFAEAMARPYLYAGPASADLVGLVRSQVIEIFVGSMGQRRPTSRDQAVAELLTDLWITNIIAIAQGRSTAREVRRRFVRTIAIVTRQGRGSTTAPTSESAPAGHEVA